MAYIITTATHKGGVGKTVTTISLGSALARMGKRTLIVDLDPQGHCGLGLGIEIEEEQQALTVRHFFQEPLSFPLKKTVRETKIENLFIAPSTIKLAVVAQSLYARPKREQILKKGLVSLKRKFDFILLDCPPSFGVLTESGIEASDYVIVPCQMEARAGNALIDLLDLVLTMRGQDFKQFRVLLTKIDMRKKVTNMAMLAQLDSWKPYFFNTQIPVAEELNQAQMAGEDIYTYNKKCKGAVAYKGLVDELIELFANEQKRKTVKNSQRQAANN